MTRDPPPSSPVCWAGEADDAYMGFAPRAELIAALNQVLEAERAIARGLRSVPADLRAGRSARAVAAMRHLAALVRGLGGTPSRCTGPALADAMAVAEPTARTAFLDGEARRLAILLDALRPRIRDDGLHATVAKLAGR